MTDKKPVVVTYQEVFEAMQALYNGTFTQQAIAAEMGKTKLYIAPPTQPEQEPVAWLVEFENGEQEFHFEEQAVGESCIPLYTTPPQREWVGLTKEEVEDIEITWEATSEWSTFSHAVRYIEAKLKEKNT